MKVILARHGRTNYNDLGLCNADPAVDVHLTSQGIEQAKQLAQELKDVPIERIFVSELKRTQQTAAIVNEFHSVPVEVSPLLNEHRSGFEGQPTTLLLQALETADNKWTAHFNGGESIEDVKQRVATFARQLKAKPYQTVLIVTSQWVVQAALAAIKNMPNQEAWDMDVQQGSSLEIEI